MRKDLATALCVAVVLILSSILSVGQDKQEEHEPQGVNPAGGGVPAVSLKHFEAKSSGPTPRTSDGKPDLSGVWGPGLNMGNIAVNLKPGEELPLNPWALKLTEERSTPEAKRTDPKPNCLPDGVPREDPFPYKIVQTPKLIVFLLEGNVHSYRQIFMDGSGHPTDDLEPSYYGDSRGHWEGDTLVIDTIGFNDKTWFDGAGHPHTEKLHVIERYQRPDSAHLEFEVTIDDPGAYTRPFKIYGHSPLLLNTDLMEYWCIENGAQDLIHLVK
jgi:hypothetical protein